MRINRTILGMVLGGVGAVVLLIGVLFAHAQERRLATYVRAEATIVSAAVVPTERAHSYRSRETYRSIEHVPVIEYEYVVDGRAYRSTRLAAIGDQVWPRAEAERVVAAHPAGSRHPSWHDPDDPSEAFLLRDASDRPYFAILIAVPWLAIGVALISVGRGASRARAAVRAGVTVAGILAVAGAHYVHVVG